MLYNWTLEQSIFTTIKGKDWEFMKSKNPYDLSEIVEDSWVKDAIARGYLVENTSKNTSEDTANSPELIG